MEIALNLAWGLCSLGLIWFWLRLGAGDRKNAGKDRSDRLSRRSQFLALGLVLLLLLPVISLSDDLVAAQGLTETDSCLRRATQGDSGHPSVIPTAVALPQEYFMGLMPCGVTQEVFLGYRPIVPAAFVSSALDSRPPPSLL